MASRNRQSTARPPTNRQSVASTPSSSRNIAGTSLPPYKKPSHPLNATAQLKLRQIYDNRTSQSLKDHQQNAIKYITEAAGCINDHVREREERVDRRRKKWEKGEHLEEQDAYEAELQELQESVSEMTRKLEESMRAAIDAGEAAQRIEETLTWVRENAPRQLEQEYATQVMQRQSQSQPQTQRRSQRDEDGEEAMEDQAEEDEGPTPGPTPLTQARAALTGTSEMFTDQLEKKKNEYLLFSHGARYSKSNGYIGFKRMVHDARFRDDGPSLPHPDTWFTDRGSPAPGVTDTQEDAEDEDDIVVDKATISTRCPITFQQFQEPYTSKKCPHTFEKYAILDFIRNSATRVGNGPRGRGERAIQCPVSGCDQMLTAADLYNDQILIRKIKRMQQAEAQPAEESDVEDDAAPRGSGEAGEDSDDDVRATAHRRMKREVSSTVPATQDSRASTATVGFGTWKR